MDTSDVVAKAIAAAGGPDAIREAHARRERTHLWLDKEWERLLDEYPEQWIAVHDDEVIANAASLDDLGQKLHVAGHGIQGVVISHLTRDQKVKLLRVS